MVELIPVSHKIQYWAPLSTLQMMNDEWSCQTKSALKNCNNKSEVPVWERGVCLRNTQSDTRLHAVPLINWLRLQLQTQGLNVLKIAKMFLNIRHNLFFSSKFGAHANGKTTNLSSDCPRGLCISLISFLEGSKRLLQYSDYRAWEINWTN